MPRYPGAIWEPITGGTDGPMREYRFIVLHVNDSDGADLFNWENGGAHNMSSHFQFPKVGRPFQYLDTATDSWCQANGNMVGISFEVEGFPTEPMNENQLNEIAACAAWVNQVHGTPLQITDDPVNGSGLITHGAGGTSWGGHTGCPGPYRTAQRQEILNRAKGNDSMSAAEVAEIKTYIDTAMSGVHAKLDPESYALLNSVLPAVANMRPLVQNLAQLTDTAALAAKLAPALAPVLGQLLIDHMARSSLTEADVERAVSTVLAGTTFQIH